MVEEYQEFTLENVPFSSVKAEVRELEACLDTVYPIDENEKSQELSTIEPLERKYLS